MGVPYAEVIGDPIAHSKSPLIHNFWLGKLGLPYEYRSRRVSSAELPAYLEDHRHDPLWCGSSVTIPHKQAVIGHLDRFDLPAAPIGAVNAITREGAADARLVGHNTDALGFLDILHGWPAVDRSVRVAGLIGTGGAAAAIAWALTQMDFLLFVYTRDRDRGAAFRRRFAEPDMDFVQSLESLANPQPYEGPASAEVADILINATPLGMRGFPALAINLGGMPVETLICDLVYNPAETELLRAARARGHPVIGGLEMLIAQAAHAFPLFFAVEAPREHDAELRELLSR